MLAKTFLLNVPATEIRIGDMLLGLFSETQPDKLSLRYLNLCVYGTFSEGEYLHIMPGRAHNGEIELLRGERSTLLPINGTVLVSRLK